MFVLQFANGMWYGKGWRPYSSKASAVRFKFRSQAEERIRGINQVFAANPSFDQSLLPVRIVEVDK